MKIYCTKITMVLFLTLILCISFSGCSPSIEQLPDISQGSASVAPSATAAPTPAPTPAPTATPAPTPEPITYTGALELPVIGASGYASVELNLRAAPNTEAQSQTVLSPGQGFTVLAEQGEWWQVDVAGMVGWVSHKYCLVNLPDVIPSIVYDNTNTYASKMKSSGTDIPTITGLQLYEAKTENPRLGKAEYIVPVLYSMAAPICAAQKLALAQGNTLIIYEGFRPYDVQLRIVAALRALIAANETVRIGVTADPWSIDWFIATDVSNHQQGYAIDVSLGSVDATATLRCGAYGYTSVLSYTEYEMPTPIHELSIASVSMSCPVTSLSDSLWKTVVPATSMNESALLLQKYCTDAGLTPLASEWWHFNDLPSALAVSTIGSRGEYTLSSIFSQVP